MAETLQWNADISTGELFEFYLKNLPPYLSINTTVEDRSEPTACSVSGFGHSKIRDWIKEGNLKTKMVDGKRKVLTFDLLKILFNAPEDQPVPLKHNPLEGRQYRRSHKRVEPQLPTPKRKRFAAQNAQVAERA
jgi:hypothetical protein